MTVRAFGDSALVADVADVDRAHALRARLLRRIERAGDETWAGLEEIVVGFDTVTVIADPVAADLDAMADDLASSRRWGVAGTGPGSSVGDRGPDRAAARSMEIPVVFDGPDLAAVAEAAHTTEAGVVDMLTGAELTVAFVGFAPGFAYLHGLPAPLAALDRRSTARPSVPAGAVALAGGFAGGSPPAAPGGWQLVGRSRITLFRPDRAPYAVLQPGDRVRFTVGADAEGAVPTPGPPGGQREPEGRRRGRPAPPSAGKRPPRARPRGGGSRAFDARAGPRPDRGRAPRGTAGRGGRPRRPARRQPTGGQRRGGGRPRGHRDRTGPALRNRRLCGGDR